MDKYKEIVKGIEPLKIDHIDMSGTLQLTVIESDSVKLPFDSYDFSRLITIMSTDQMIRFLKNEIDYLERKFHEK